MTQIVPMSEFEFQKFKKLRQILQNNRAFRLREPNDKLEDIVINLRLNEDLETLSDTAMLPYDSHTDSNPTLFSYPTPNITSPESVTSPQSPPPIDILQNIIDNFYNQFQITHEIPHISSPRFLQA